MKKIIEEVVERNQDIIKYITRLVAESDAWVFISGDLYEDLGIDYVKKPFYKDDGAYFYTNDNHIGILSEESNITLVWKKVNYISKSGVYIADNPEIIYFLS